MRIEIDTDKMTFFDLYLLRRMIETMEQNAATETHGEAVDETLASDAPGDDAPATTKRSRRKKSDHLKVVETPEPEAVVEAEVQAEPQAVADETPPDHKPLSVDDVRVALQSFSRKNGVPASVELLKKFNASRISDLDPAHYREFVGQCGA